MKLTHMGISHFRSIGAEPVMIDLSKKITVLVGQNDGGKSNVLRGVQQATEAWSSKTVAVSEIDWHKRDGNCRPFVHIRVEREPSDSPNAMRWPSVTILSSMSAKIWDAPICQEIQSLGLDELDSLASEWGFGVSLQAGGRERRALLLRGIANDMIKLARPPALDMHLIPQFRRIEDTEKYSVDGRGIIKLLAKWQVPDIGEDHLEKKLGQIEQLLRLLLGRPLAKIEVPPTHDKIIVRDGTMRLPLESHGTGVHQLIILAIAVLSQDNVIFGIEEPEIHLHPLLQKRFMQFLLHETTNRYVITTHSASLIAPSEEVEVIHLKMVDGVTIPSRVQTDAGSLAILEDLGHQPSDLLQANSVIWVEGPSDRVYLNCWIHLLYPNLVEGIDYSIMFYGGRLLSHLTMEREEEAELTDFVKLLRINQRSALVMDSDRKASSETLNPTKIRIIDECKRNDVQCWVTDGREIENDLAPRTVQAALAEAGQLDGKVAIKPFAKFDDSMSAALQKSKKSWCDYGTHKAAWAHRFAKHIAIEDMSTELQAHVHELVKALCPQAQVKS